MFTVYVIENSKGTKYTGFTSNLQLRLLQHNNGKPGNYTYKRGPWKLIYKEHYENKSEASKREKFLKAGNLLGAYLKHRGIEQLAARKAHNLEVPGSSPGPATTGQVSLTPLRFSFQLKLHNVQDNAP